MKNKVILSLGSNLGSREENISKAIELLCRTGALTLLKKSSFYKTEPYGITNQNWFVNMALTGLTELSPEVLLYFCKTIELLVGRKKRERWTEREIDIDILFYDNIILESEKLTIPHPEVHLRNFVLEPLAEIEADFIHPVLHKTILEIKQSSKDNSKVFKNEQG